MTAHYRALEAAPSEVQASSVTLGASWPTVEASRSSLQPTPTPLEVSPEASGGPRSKREPARISREVSLGIEIADWV